MTEPRIISVEEENNLRLVFRYDPETGYLYRKTGPYILKERKVGTPIGRGSYLQVKIGNKSHYVHRVIWFILFGTWPNSIDHIDGDTWNNKQSNLREVTHSQNQANRPHRSSSKTGIKGVVQVKNKFMASITISRKQIHIGLFDSIEEATVAYREKAIELYGEFANVN